ncbi:MAG: response regulator [Nitrospirae bacterium]|nr:response regulator [Nitrospirota bacterium]
MPGKILIVYDTEQNRTLLKDVLDYYDFESLTAADGAEGVSMAKEHQPDLILMDVQMPVMDGISATRLLKSDPETKAIKILALTSFVAEDLKCLQEAGFDDFISKPIDIRRLPEIVRRHLSVEVP